ncbi:hypothetical protein [Massilia horti]|uniref:PEGA domain-containing protein n=1 Tax=Massilia horti TaxID=2562153 RepID=A0A4Y9T0A3_9BURK|nr:hypothetical protein [Massilia horti]TFW30918.1 hypothetical protein E4O92_15180 [Massilia horti]
MTSTIGTEAQQDQGRTLRDIVLQHHELVNEAFCRKIFRRLLASLELQYAMQMPHRAITPDCVAFMENDEPILLPSSVDGDWQDEAADLRALASVVHFAITREWPPEAPLAPRHMPGYGDALTGAIDQCLFAEPDTRPQTIAQLRDLLGIVSLEPPMPALQQAPFADSPDTKVPPIHPPSQPTPGWLQRWLLIGAAACVLLAAAAAWLALLHGTNSGDLVTLGLPVTEHAAPEPYASETATTSSLDAQETLVEAAPVPETPAQTPPAAPAPPAIRTAAATPAATTYKLLIKPWGKVYVDGKERGISPPLKRLTLPAGRHTVRVANPNFPDRVLHIEAGKSASGKIDHDFSVTPR